MKKMLFGICVIVKMINSVLLFADNIDHLQTNEVLRLCEQRWSIDLLDIYIRPETRCKIYMPCGRLSYRTDYTLAMHANNSNRYDQLFCYLGSYPHEKKASRYDIIVLYKSEEWYVESGKVGDIASMPSNTLDRVKMKIIRECITDSYYFCSQFTELDIFEYKLADRMHNISSEAITNIESKLSYKYSAIFNDGNKLEAVFHYDGKPIVIFWNDNEAEILLKMYDEFLMKNDDLIWAYNNVHWENPLGVEYSIYNDGFNLSKIGDACKRYAMNHNGYFPYSLKYLNGYLCNPFCLIAYTNHSIKSHLQFCDVKSDDYNYQPGACLDSPVNTIVAYATMKDEGNHITYLGLRVDAKLEWFLDLKQLKSRMPSNQYYDHNVK